MLGDSVRQSNCMQRGWSSQSRKEGGQLELEGSGDVGGEVLEADGRASNASQSDSIQRQPGQSTHLHLPLDVRLGRVLIAMPTHDRVLVQRLIATAVLQKHRSNPAHDDVGVVTTGRLRTPCEANAPRRFVTRRRHTRRGRYFTSRWWRCNGVPVGHLLRLWRHLLVNSDNADTHTHTRTHTRTPLFLSTNTFYSPQLVRWDLTVPSMAEQPLG